MARKKTIVYLDEGLVRAAQVMAERTGQKDFEVYEAALKEYLGLGILERTQGRSDLGEAEAVALADEEVHAVRRQRAKRTRRTSQ